MRQAPTASDRATPNATAIAESNASLLLAPAAFTTPLILLNANSIGLKSGLYPGKNTSSQPLASIASRTSGLAAADELLAPLDQLTDNHAPTSTVARTLSWTRLIAGALTDDAATVAAAAASIEAGPDSLEKRAAPIFAAVFGGQVNTDDVEAMAAELREAGLGFEASQLTGSAALRSGDEDATRDLLALSRQLRNERRQSGGGRSGDVEALSDREVEVARLVVLGRTHKEIGAELFISAKTVEHHVARIRRKLGATSRAEMMAAIRDYLDRHASID